MKKYLILFVFAIFAVSCSKKVEFNGKVKGGSPLERVEFIEASGVATLPLINVGVDKDGNFSGSFDAPKDGMYVISYAGQQNLIYLKQGQTLNISGEAGLFPSEFKIEGDAKANNDFLQNVQKFMVTYTQNLNMQEMMKKDEKAFLADFKKIKTDLEKEIEKQAKATKADQEVINWKKNDINVGLLSVLPRFEMMKKNSEENPSFKVSKAFKDFEESLQENKEELVKEQPRYRQYLFYTIEEDFKKYAEANRKDDSTASELYLNYFKKRDDFSQETKDYLLAYIVATEMNPSISDEAMTKLDKIVNEEIKTPSVKKDLQDVILAVAGPKTGEIAPEAALVKQDGKAFKLDELKGRPTVLMSYASWSPYIQDSALPILKQVMSFYKGKANFVFVNFDDTKEQFEKTSKSLLKDFDGTNVYATNGLNSDFAKKYGIYGFKLQPTYVIIDKDGKIAGKTVFNLGDGSFIELLDKLTGMKAPELNPQATLQNDILATPVQEEAKKDTVTAE